MLTYVIRRLLLLPPTLIGMTALVFIVLVNAPGGIGASLLSRTGEMKPAERKVREDYLNRRYGLDKPKIVQFGRWLNKLSPLGFGTYDANEPAVQQAAVDELRNRAPLQTQIDAFSAQLPALESAGAARLDELEALHAKIHEIEAQRNAIRVLPRAGDVVFTRPRIKWPDLGDSFVRGRPVNALIGEALPITLLLQIISLPISYALAIWLGIQQSRTRGSLFDYSVSGSTLALWSVPSIWACVLAVGFLANPQFVAWFPATGLNVLNDDSMMFLPHWINGRFQGGWLFDRVYHLILPVACLTYANFAFLSRLTRGALLDNLNADYVRTARAKGLSENVILYQHAFRNSLIPLITALASLLPALIGGSVVVENVFSINGMGKLAVDAATQRDFELLLSLTAVTGVLEMICYLLSDMAYALADPRVSYE